MANHNSFATYEPLYTIIFKYLIQLKQPFITFYFKYVYYHAQDSFLCICSTHTFIDDIVELCLKEMGFGNGSPITTLAFIILSSNM